jgi:SM-20-related protein
MDKNIEAIKEEDQFERLIKGLIEDDYGCCDDFILQSTVSGLSTNIQSLHDSSNMKPSGLGNKTNLRKDNKFRSDKINWIEDLSTNEFESIFLKKITKFIDHLNKTCFTSIKSFESHYASYDKNDFYKRHLDQFKNDKGRQYSIVLYLNEDWQAKDGGLLSLYPEGKNEIKIAPLGGRLVFFKSDLMEHEVHASFTRERRSIAGWLKN